MENNQTPSLTPSPAIVSVPNNPHLTFGEALLEVVNGKKITRESWNNTDYGFLKDTFLAIYKNGVTFNNWLVNDGDILATDWVVIE